MSRSTLIPRKRHLLIVFLFLIFAWAFFDYYSSGILPSFITKTLNLPNGASSSSSPSYDPFDFIDPLIGTTNGGHVFPGASLPFSMIKAGADKDVPGENQGGYVSDDSKVYGFSHMHDSGTGGSSGLGNFPVWVFPECVEGDVDSCDWVSEKRAERVVEGSVRASPGYFAVELENGVRAEMTVGKKVAIYRFRFTENARVIARERVKEKRALRGLEEREEAGERHTTVLLDARDLSNSGYKLQVHVHAQTGRIRASGTYNPSFGEGSYQAYACAEILGVEKQDFEVGMLKQYGFVKLPPDIPEVIVRVGISFKSIDQACGNAERGIPDFDFDGTLKAAQGTWRKQLDVIKIKPGDGVSKELQTVFWSGIYRSSLSPQDYTGENPLWFSDEPYYDSYYCIWDSFRSIHPLITLIDPKSQTRMVRSLLDIYKNVGKLPDCRMSLCKGFTQGGSNADVVIVDAFLKNMTEGVDWNLAYEAVVSDAEEEPVHWSVEGRGGVESWKNLGYIPYLDEGGTGMGLRTRSVSRTMEYAYNDFTISLLASALGHHEDAAKYLQRSANWKNLFRTDQRSFIEKVDTGFEGFLQPRWANGSWFFQDPIRCSYLMWFHSCYLDAGGGETYEGTIWMYGFYVPQDHKSLITTLGGREQFIKRLDFLHDTPGLLYIGDEQAFLPVFQYHYAGAPAKSVDKAHFYIPAQFNASINGIPGNDDSGGMGSFAALTMMGVWPVPGQDVYLINPPFFEEVSIRNDITGKVARIVNRNFDASYKRRYIQRAWMDGREWTRNWFQHKFWMEGGTLELELGDTPGTWGTREEDVPPSYSPP